MEEVMSKIEKALTFGKKMVTFGKAGQNFHKNTGAFLKQKDILTHETRDEAADAFWAEVNSEDTSWVAKKMKSRRAGNKLIDSRKEDGTVRWSELQDTFPAYRSVNDTLKNIYRAADVHDATFVDGVCTEVADEPRGIAAVVEMIYDKKGNLIPDGQIRQLAVQHHVGDKEGAKKGGESPIETVRRASELLISKSGACSFEDVAELEEILNRTYEKVSAQIMKLNRKAA
jgi:hypothetical protein